VNTTSAPAASSASECARRAFVPSRLAKAAGETSKAITSPACFVARLRAIGPPMLPSPTKPIAGVPSVAIAARLSRP
jgi:hypothetical protein